jgi:hypothetical protein
MFQREAEIQHRGSSGPSGRGFYQRSATVSFVSAGGVLAPGSAPTPNLPPQLGDGMWLIGERQIANIP